MLVSAKAGSHGWTFNTSALSDTILTFSAQQVNSKGEVAMSSDKAILGSTRSDTVTGTTGDDFRNGYWADAVFTPAGSVNQPWLPTPTAVTELAEYSPDDCRIVPLGQ
jgi:hypothetical protein